MQEVKITITDGSPVVEVKCVKCQACTMFTRDLEAALGEAEVSTPTSEYYEKATQAIKASR